MSAWPEMCQSPPSLQPSSPLHKEQTFWVIYWSWWISWGVSYFLNQIYVFCSCCSFFKMKLKENLPRDGISEAAPCADIVLSNTMEVAPATSSQSDTESQNHRTIIKWFGLKGSLSLVLPMKNHKTMAVLEAHPALTWIPWRPWPDPPTGALQKVWRCCGSSPVGLRSWKLTWRVLTPPGAWQEWEEGDAWQRNTEPYCAVWGSKGGTKGWLQLWSVCSLHKGTSGTWMCHPSVHTSQASPIGAPSTWAVPQISPPSCKWKQPPFPHWHMQPYKPLGTRSPEIPTNNTAPGLLGPLTAPTIRGRNGSECCQEEPQGAQIYPGMHHPQAFAEQGPWSWVKQTAGQ